MDFDVEVTVPATAANLGPGFDCLGVALGAYLKVRFTPSEQSQIKGKGRIRSVENNLIHRSFKAAFGAAGEQAPPVCIEMVEVYPSGRGLGASASAIVAGLIGARKAGALKATEDELATLAIDIEGHADNVLPALFGGLMLTGATGWTRFEPTNRISPIVLVAARGFKTEAARRVVPDKFTRTDAVTNASATALLVAALSGAAPAAELFAATSDRLHEPYRLPLMPETLQLHTGLRARGVATALSGAGPSLICLVEATEIEGVARKARGLLPHGWSLLAPGWDVQGARASA